LFPLGAKDGGPDVGGEPPKRTGRTDRALANGRASLIFILDNQGEDERKKTWPAGTERREELTEIESNLLGL